MRDLLSRIGTWVAVLGVLFSQTMPAWLPHLQAQEQTLLSAESAQTLLTTTVATTVVLNEFLTLPAGPLGTQDFIELANPTAASVTITNWTLATSTTTLATLPVTTLTAAGTAGAFLLVSLPNLLPDAQETLLLKNPSGTIIDQIRYGANVSADLKAPAAGKSAGRLNDGETTWYVDLVPTPGSTNGARPQLASPNSLAIRAGSQNRAGVINLNNQANVLADVNLPSTALATDTVSVELIDSTGTLRSGTIPSLTGVSLVTVVFNLTQAPALLDGSLIFRSYATNTGGASTAYRIGTAVVKDTVAPSGPSTVAVAATSETNATNVINEKNSAAVKTTVTLPATTTAQDIVTVTLSDGAKSVVQTAAAPGGGGTVTVQTVTPQTINTTSLADGAITVSATITDEAGNQSIAIQTNAVKDTQAPVVSFTINSGATVAKTNSVNLTISASDVGTGVTEMMVSHSQTFSGAVFENFTTGKTWELPTGEGLKTVWLAVRDGALNTSATAAVSILVEQDVDQIDLIAIATGTQTVRRLPIELDITATSPTTLTRAIYTTNPGSSLPTGLAGITGFREIGIADPTKITFPIFLKIYYTETDLRVAGVTSENQLKGIAFFDTTSQTWKLYGSTGVNSADVTVDGQAFAGYLFANADHLSPMTGLADTTPPSAPAQIQATAGDQSIRLSWPAVSDAASYLVRYRTTGETNANYTTVTLPASQTATVISNLVNGTQYEFGVAARDSSGNTSAFTTVNATPAAPIETAPTVAGPNVMAIRGQPAAGGGRVTPQPTPTATVSAAPSPGPAESEDQRDLGRFLVTLAILLIAIGAALAGFYGWQWFEQQGQPRPTKPAGPAPPPAGSPVRTTGQPLPPVPPNDPPHSSAAVPPAPPPAVPTAPPASDKPPTPPDQSTPPPEGRW